MPKIIDRRSNCKNGLKAARLSLKYSRPKKRLSRNVSLLSDFLEQMLDDYQPPQLERKALVHGHCHHKAIMAMESEKQLFPSSVSTTNCSIPGAAAWHRGLVRFEHAHYDVSMQVGELAYWKCGRRQEIP